MTAWLDRAAIGAALLLPFVLLHGRGLADAALSAIGAMFLLRSALVRDWSWLRRPWAGFATLWWGWLLLCSLRAGAVGQAAGTVRFLLFAAALQHWVLRAAAVRGWLARLLRWAAFYLAAQCLLQFATGRNLFGWPRGSDGELTGPYKNARAGAPLSRLLFPALLPLGGSRLAMAAWLGAGLLVMILIGQRMPLLLSALGLAVSALLLPRLRVPALAAGGLAGVLLVALPVLSPEAAHRIERKFAAQMLNFPDSPYGQIAARAMRMVEAHPWFGAGFDGFRRLCDDPAYFRGWQDGDGGGAAICVQHPHNIYLQAAIDGGWPGLALFVLLALAWLRAIGRGLWRAPDRLRVGLFAAGLIHLWPLASSNDWMSMPTAGWFFLQLGLALALAAPYMPAQRNREA